MFCKNCGSQLDGNSVFCPNCGNPVKKEEPVNVDLGFNNNQGSSVNQEPIVDLGNNSISDVNQEMGSNLNNNINSFNAGMSSGLDNNVNSFSQGINNDLNNSMNTFNQGINDDLNNSMNTFDQGINSDLNNSMNTFNQGINSNLNNNLGSSNQEMNFNSNKSHSLRNLIIIILVCALLCGAAVFVYLKFFKNNGESNAKVIESALNNMTGNNMSNVKSGAINVKMDFEAEEDGELVNGALNLNSKIDITNKMAELKLSVNASGMSIEVPVYADFNTGREVIYFQNPMDNQWSKLSLAGMLGTGESDLGSGTEQNVTFYVEDYLRNNDFIEKVKSDDKDVIKFRLHFTKDILKKISEDSANDFDLSSYEGSGLENGFDIDLYINKKDNYVTKLELDLSNKTLGEQKFNKLIFSIELTDLNKVSGIVIPDAALSALEFDMSSLMGGMVPDGSFPDMTIPDTTIPDTTIPDMTVPTTGGNTLEFLNTVVTVDVPAGYIPSEFNTSSLLIYRNNNGLRTRINLTRMSKDLFLQEAETTANGYNTIGYTDISVGEIKELEHNGKMFNYRVVQYVDTVGNNHYEVYLCHSLDTGDLYNVIYQDEEYKGAVTETAIRDFLNFTVSTK